MGAQPAIGAQISIAASYEAEEELELVAAVIDAGFAIEEKYLLIQESAGAVPANIVLDLTTEATKAIYAHGVDVAFFGMLTIALRKLNALRKSWGKDGHITAEIPKVERNLIYVIPDHSPDDSDAIAAIQSDYVESDDDRSGYRVWRDGHWVTDDEYPG